ncbi:MAG: hypothetical protein HN904_24730 [Victivallales bacterium]|nr:hypothetical protein [Victivallales bacterium]
MRLRNIRALCVASMGFACLASSGGEKLPAMPKLPFAFAEATEIAFRSIRGEKTEFTITDKAEIARLSKLIVLKRKEPCKCEHIETATFRKGKAEIYVHFCSHCFVVRHGRRNYDHRMPTGFYPAYQKLLEQHRQKAAKGQAAAQE